MSGDHVLLEDGSIYTIDSEGRVRERMTFKIPIQDLWMRYLEDGLSGEHLMNVDVNGRVSSRTPYDEIMRVVNHSALLLTDQVLTDSGIMYGGVGYNYVPFEEYQSDLDGITQYQILPEDRHGCHLIEYDVGETRKWVRVFLYQGQVYSPPELLDKIFTMGEMVSKINSILKWNHLIYFGDGTTLIYFIVDEGKLQTYLVQN